MPNAKMNYADKDKLGAVVAMLIAFDQKPTRSISIAEVYMDYGAGMKWETILVKNSKYDSSFQLLSPRQWDEIDHADTPEALAKIATELLAVLKNH